MAESSSASSINLYPHQVEAVAAVRAAFRSGSPVAMLTLPTGSGKSYLFSEFIRQMIEASRAARVLVIVPKVKLAEQNARTMETMTGQHVDVYCASLGLMKLGPLTVATYQSLMNAERLPTFDIIIIDECHRFDGKQDSLQRELLKKLSHPKTRVLGLTATPFKGARPIWLASDFWPEPCYSVSIGDLTRQGFLAPARMVQGKHAHSTKGFKVIQGDWSRDDLNALAADANKMHKQVKDALSHVRDQSRQSVIWMCIDQAHARSVHEYLTSLGEKSSLVVSDQSRSERNDAFDDFIQAGSKHLVSVEIAKEGFDDPKTDCIVFLKATRSIVSYVQAVGRGLRVLPGKSYCLVLDYGQVVQHCGKLDAPMIDWTGDESRDSSSSRARVTEEMPYVVVNCKACGSFFFPERGDPKDCPDCGTNCDDDRTKKLREQAASGELYSSKDAIDTEFSRFTVTSVSCVTTDEGGHVTLGVKSAFFGSSVAGSVTLELYAPLNARGLNQGLVNRIAHTKHWLSRAFAIDRNTSAREMLRIVASKEYKVMPDVIVQTRTRIGYGVESVRDVVKSEGIQETLL